MAKAIYRLSIDCGRMGEIGGIFVAEKKAVQKAIGQEVYFGEVLGKHSEICGTLLSKEVEEVTDNKEAVEIFEKYKLANGYNPLDYLEANTQ